ncbi:hypothetical protein RRG08_062716 [Elysia crispata]|uniref:Uncharacterized protein n=1 Tax=Elysia crispata TaxID=231223 RepID=A0AAE1ACZ1_9GAST|nr:hypothetical protein RRG08_062716 [Elysia crispata]
MCQSLASGGKLQGRNELGGGVGLVLSNTPGNGESKQESRALSPGLDESSGQIRSDTVTRGHNDDSEQVPGFISVELQLDRCSTSNSGSNSLLTLAIRRASPRHSLTMMHQENNSEARYTREDVSSLPAGILFSGPVLRVLCKLDWERVGERALTVCGRKDSHGVWEKGLSRCVGERTHTVCGRKGSQGVWEKRLSRCEGERALTVCGRKGSHGVREKGLSRCVGERALTVCGRRAWMKSVVALGVGLWAVRKLSVEQSHHHPNSNMAAAVFPVVVHGRPVMLMQHANQKSNT